MSNEIQCPGLTTGLTTYYARVFDPVTGNILNTTSHAFEVYSSGNIALYRTDLTELSPGRYGANMPAGATANGDYPVGIYQLASSGAAAAVGDANVGSGTTNIGGTILASAGLDGVVIETGLNLRQAISILAAESAGKLAASGSTITFAGAGVSTNRITATVDGTGNRTAVAISPPA